MFPSEVRRLHANGFCQHWVPTEDWAYHGLDLANPESDQVARNKRAKLWLEKGMEMLSHSNGRAMLFIFYGGEKAMVMSPAESLVFFSRTRGVIHGTSFMNRI